MKSRIGIGFLSVVIVAATLTGCVSTKKYKASQATVQQLRNDSMRLAQEVSTANGNVQNLEQQKKTLQQSLDSSMSSYANQQKTLNNYQAYFTKQEAMTTQLGDELKSALTQAGIADGNVQQTSDGIQINLDETNTFKKNSVAISTTGKQALNSVAEVLKNHPDANVTVANGEDNSMSSMNSDNMNKDNMNNSNASSDRNVQNNSSSENTVTTGKTKTETDDAMPAKTSTKRKTTTNSANSAKSYTVSAKKKVHTGTVKHKTTSRSTEGYATRFSTSGKKSSSAALKTGRINAVANNLLQNGIQKINVMITRPSESGMNAQNNNIKIIVSPKMPEFTPEKNSSTSRNP